MLVMNRDPLRYSTDYQVYMGSSMIVRPLADCHCTCALINWMVLLQGMTLADCLCTVPPWVMEVAMYCILLGAALAMAATQLWLGEDLIVVEPGFPEETSYRQHENLIGEFSAKGDGVLAAVDVEDIIHNAPHK